MKIYSFLCPHTPKTRKQCSSPQNFAILLFPKPLNLICRKLPREQGKSCLLQDKWVEQSFLFLIFLLCYTSLVLEGRFCHKKFLFPTCQGYVLYLEELDAQVHGNSLFPLQTMIPITQILHESYTVSSIYHLTLDIIFFSISFYLVSQCYNCLHGIVFYFSYFGKTFRGVINCFFTSPSSESHYFAPRLTVITDICWEEVHWNCSWLTGQTPSLILGYYF